jgi:hypothetical protein
MENLYFSPPVLRSCAFDKRNMVHQVLTHPKRLVPAEWLDALSPQCFMESVLCSVHAEMIKVCRQWYMVLWITSLGGVPASIS